MQIQRACLLGALCALFFACAPEVQVEPSTSGGGGSAGAGGNVSGGSGGTIEVDAGQVADAMDVPDASNPPDDVTVYPIDGLACASRPVTCIPDPKGPPPSELPSQQLESLYDKCCIDVSCGCNSRCQTTKVVFDADGCATEMTIEGYISSPLVECLRKYLSEQRWECAPGQTAEHLPLCNPC
jgi:hypothetical protein